jgi:predicted Rossmann fold nucleotide-binding protein DprA/Smf involved in DNA uptake
LPPTKRDGFQDQSQPQPNLFDSHAEGLSQASEEDVQALRALFYFRRTLDYQGLSLCIQHFRPLHSFFMAREEEFRDLFARAMHLRGVVDAWQLADQEHQAAALTYGARVRELLRSQFPGQLVLAGQPGFPERLHRSRLPIHWLFCHPKPPPVARGVVVAVIGSRKSSREQLQAANTTASLLVEIGVQVVTGLASGADEAAHSAARLRPDCTMAVLGSGIQKVSPKAKLDDLRELIAQGGTVLTEVPPDYNANAEAFVLRNRVISSLADIVVVASGQYASGTAHTVRFAADAGVALVSIDPVEGSGISKLVAELGGQIMSPRFLVEGIEAGTL